MTDSSFEVSPTKSKYCNFDDDEQQQQQQNKNKNKNHVVNRTADVVSFVVCAAGNEAEVAAGSDDSGCYFCGLLRTFGFFLGRPPAVLSPL